MLHSVVVSLLRWIIGLSTGALAGFLLAYLNRRETDRLTWISRLLDFLRAIPIIGLVPVVQMNIGINEYGKIGLIAWGVAFPVWLTVQAASKRDMTDLELTLSASRLPKRRVYWCYSWPKLAAGLIRGIEIGIGIAWLCLVAAEWVGTYSTGFWSGGLGYDLLLAYNNNQWIKVHLVLIIFGVLGTTSSFVWRVSVNWSMAKIDGVDFLQEFRKGAGGVESF